MPPRLEKISVYYQPGQNPNIRFVTQHPKGKNTKKRELLFRNDHFDGFMLHYRLDHPSFGDLKFPNDPQRALSSAVMTGPENECPTTGVWPQFTPVSVTDDNRTLVVRNCNGDLQPGQTEVQFGYTLFVTDDPDYGELTPLDPIGTNMNG